MDDTLADLRDDAPLIYDGKAASTSTLRTYRRRWYILVMFAVIGSYQGAVWNFYNVIPHSSELVLGWNIGTLATLTNWGPITAVLFTPPLMGLLSLKGLRTSVVLATFLVVLSTALKCISFRTSHVVWLAHVGAIIIGTAAPVLMAGQPAIAAVWFSHKERVTATSVCTVINNLAISSLIGLYSVRDCVDPKPMLDTFNDDSSNDSCANNGTALVLMKEDMEQLAYVECGVAAAIFLAVLVYFPSKPPSAPSVSASVERMKFCEGVQVLLKKRQMWLVIMVSALSNGIFGSWLPLLSVNMQQLNIDQKQAAWMNFYASLGTIVAGLLTARLVDYLSGKMKRALLCLMMAGLLSILWVTIQCEGLVPFSAGSLTASVILAGSFIPATLALLLEISCEIAYPVPESVAGGLLTISNNCVAIVFLFIFLIPNIGVAWMNWVMLGSMACCVVLMSCYRERYTRMALDASSAHRLPTVQ